MPLPTVMLSPFLWNDEMEERYAIRLPGPEGDREQVFVDTDTLLRMVSVIAHNRLNGAPFLGADEALAEAAELAAKPGIPNLAPHFGAPIDAGLVGAWHEVGDWVSEPAFEGRPRSARRR